MRRNKLLKLTEWNNHKSQQTMPSGVGQISL